MAKKHSRKASAGSIGIADFCYEAGMLAKTPRSYFPFLGSGSQSVAEHINRVCYIGYALAKMADADASKTVLMCLFHDFTEARISDLNYVYQKYNVRKETEALADFTRGLPFGADIRALVEEYELRSSKEALLAKDADNIEFILGVKEEQDAGNAKGKLWLKLAFKRLLTAEGRALARQILDTSSDNWWFNDKSERWWVHRKRK